MYVEHPLVKENTIESRLYQEVIVGKASQGNTLVVAPTALGKTIIAILLAAHRLERFPDSRIVMLSPTRPLVNQHTASFKSFLKLNEGEVNAFTGYAPPLDREDLWRNSRVICATPQVIKNDLAQGRYSLENVSLVIFDEAHRCTGNYPYALIAREYLDTAGNPLILGLTASPGGDEDKIMEVKEKLFIENIEVRTDGDPDVKPYVKGIKVEWRRVELPETMERLRELLEEVLKKRLGKLKEMGLPVTADPRIPKKELLEARKKIQNELEVSEAPELYAAISNVAACINLSHAIELLETQGLETLRKYFERLQKQTSKAAKGLMKETKFLRAVRLTENFSQELHHPKLDALVEIVREEDWEDKRMIVFTQYRDSAQKIVEELEGVDGIRPVRFVGQAMKEMDKGLTQKEQLDILDRFRSGEYNTLVATSVAEEGLDLPKVDLVVFYEPIPSEIRSIQRRGRTGRAKAGKVVVLITKKSKDEGFYWSSLRREKKMRQILEDLKGGIKKEQKQLQDYLGS